MEVTLSRDYWYIASTVFFVVVAAIFVPRLFIASSVGAAFGPWIGFWVVYIACLIIVTIIWLVGSIARGVRPDLIGMKDERDKRVEAKAVMGGFFVLFGTSFPSLAMQWTGQSLIAFKMLAGGGILAAGILSFNVTWDAVKTLRLSRRQT